MAQTDNLFLLIKTMSKSEKRSFKLMASKYSNNKEYINLFDIIDKQEEYDEAVIKAKLKNKKIVNQLSVAKNYLFSTIVNSLYDSTHYDTIRFKLDDLIKQIEVIKDRGLNELCIKYIEKAKKYAHQLQDFSQLIKLNKIEYDLAQKNILEIDINENNNEYLQVIENCYNYYLYEYLSRLNYCYNVLQLKSEDPYKSQKSYLLEDESLALSYKAKELLYGIWVYDYLQKLEYDKIYEIYKKIVLNFKEQYGEAVAEMPVAYGVRLSNLIAATIKIRKFDDVEVYLMELNRISNLKISNKVKYEIHGFYYYNSLNYYYETADYKKTIEILTEFFKNIKLLKKYVKRTYINWIYLLAIKLYFQMGSYKEALRYSNLLLDSKSYLPQKQYLLVRLLNLVVYYEMDDVIYVDSGIDTLRKQFKPEDSLFELIIISTLRKLINATSHFEKKKIFESLSVKIEEIKESPSASSILDFFDFTIWIKKHLQDK